MVFECKMIFVLLREKKNVSDAKAEADSNIEKDENYAKMQEILDIAQKKVKLSSFYQIFS